MAISARLERIVRGGAILGQEGARCRREAQENIVHCTRQRGRWARRVRLRRRPLHQLQQDADGNALDLILEHC